MDIINSRTILGLTTQQFGYGLNDVAVDKVISIFRRPKLAAESDVRPMLHRRIAPLAKRRKMDLRCFCLFHECPDVMGSKPAARQDFDSITGMNNQFPYKFDPFGRSPFLALLVRTRLKPISTN